MSAMFLDVETKVAERPHDHRDELRLWLRLFACKELIESEVRRRLRESFSLTLPRFDLMAQLVLVIMGTLGDLGFHVEEHGAHSSPPATASVVPVIAPASAVQR